MSPFKIDQYQDLHRSDCRNTLIYAHTSSRTVPTLWHQLTLANVTCVWKWRLCGINPAIVPKASKDGSAFSVRWSQNYLPKGHELITQGQRAALSTTVRGNSAVRIWKSRNYAFESLDWRVRCIYKCSISFIQLTSGSTVIENPTDPRLFKQLTASHENPKRHSPFSHPQNLPLSRTK